MRNWHTSAMALAGSALLAVPLLAFALPAFSAQDDKEKAQAKQELKELEEQRAKLDGRIRELRKKAGVSGANAFVFGDGKLFELPGHAGEHSIIVQKALGDAHKAVEEAMKNLPKDFHKFEFDFDKLDKDGKAFKFFIDKDGKQYKYDSNMSEEEKKKFKEQMEKMKIQIHENLKGLKDFKVHVPEFKAFSGGAFVSPKIVTPKVVTPEFRVIEPRTRGGDDDSRALRDEIRSLRDELKQLRDEVRRGKSGKSSENLDRFDNVQTL